MLTVVHAHVGSVPTWNLDPWPWLALAGLGWAYMHGRRQNWRWLSIAMIAIAAALVSPLENLAEELVSAHMVQHLLLVLVAAPAFVQARTAEVIFAALPLAVRREISASRRRFGITPAMAMRLQSPTGAFLFHAGTLLFWHATRPYEAAVASSGWHYLEHGSFLLTAVWFWQVVLAKPRTRPDAPGVGVLLVFAMGLLSVFLALLMTFAESAWYPTYAASTTTRGLDPLTDQHMAGAIMWVPAGLLYTGIGLARLVTWLNAIEKRTAT